MYGVTSVAFVAVNTMAEALVGYKVIITLLDLIALFYLHFFNSWFRNGVIGIIVASKNKIER